VRRIQQFARLRPDEPFVRVDLARIVEDAVAITRPRWKERAARDNRPLTAEEFFSKVGRTIFVSATPGDREVAISNQVVEQLIRPTGLVDPDVEVRPVVGQIDDLIAQIRARAEKSERTLVTTLTKRMAEDLSEYLKDIGIRVRWLHSDIKALERVELLRDLRTGAFDVLVGVNLLREGLDLPEVSLVCIMEADKEGFLRAERSLVQTIGRAARNVGGQVILYAERTTESMARALKETRRRRQLQLAYNQEHNITPTTIVKETTNRLLESLRGERQIVPCRQGSSYAQMAAQELASRQADLKQVMRKLEKEMKQAAMELDFEHAAELRDQLKVLKELAATGKQSKS